MVASWKNAVAAVVTPAGVREADAGTADRFAEHVVARWEANPCSVATNRPHALAAHEAPALGSGTDRLVFAAAEEIDRSCHAAPDTASFLTSVLAPTLGICHHVVLYFQIIEQLEIGI